MPNLTVAGFKRKAVAARRRLARPARFRTRGSARRFVMPQYYGAQLGRTFSTATEAEQHYADHGWRLGLLPHPYLNAPSARVSIKDAQALRDSMIGLSRGTSLPSRWLKPHDRLDLAALASRFPAALSHPGGPGGFLVENLPDVGSSTFVTLGPPAEPDTVLTPRDERPDMQAATIRITTEEFARRLTDRAELVRTILDRQLFDTEYFQAQVGTTFLSTEAALHHYLELGEDAGYSPHPFFEPEWYRAFSTSEGGPPAELFLDFVAHGATGPAGPQFDGAGETTLDEFLASTDRDSLTRPRGWALAAPVSSVDEAARRRAHEFRSERSSKRPAPRPLARHVTVSQISTEPSSSHRRALIVVDARSLRAAATPETSMSCIVDQEHRAWDLVVLTSADAPPAERAAVEAVAELDARVHVDVRPATETYGAAIERLMSTFPVDAVAFWHPSQIWRPAFLSAAFSTLSADAGLSAAVSVGPRRRHGWLTHEDPLWLSLEVAAGTLVRADAFGDRPFVETSLDDGVEWDLLLRLADSHTCAVLPADLLDVEPTPRPHDLVSARRLSNEVRGLRIARTDPSRERVTGRASVLIPTYQDWWMTCRAVREVLDTTEGHDVEIVVVDNGSRRAVSSILTTAFSHDPRVSVLRLPRNSDFALGSNVALTHSTGEFAVFLNNDITMRDEWLTALVECVREGAAAAQPLLIYPDQTIQTAGTVFLGAAVPPVHLLAGFPAEDATAALADREFSALTAACLALRAADAEALGGFDTHYVNGMEDVDFCLRLGLLTGRPLRLVPSAVLCHHESVSPRRFARVEPNRKLFVDRWRERLVTDLDDSDVLDATHLRVVGPVSRRIHNTASTRVSGLTYARPARIVPSGPAEGLPALRWSIKIAAHPGRRGDLWGDVFFADDLAAGLRLLGQEVVIDRALTHVRPDSDHLDQVTLTIRGLTPFQPQPSATNLLWVISHPDLVTNAELSSGWDAVYSAGAAWAQSKSLELGLDIRTLLQATNPERFHPLPTTSDSPAGVDVTDVLFVGRTRRVFRPVVRDAIEVGADLSVYGDDGWEDLIAERYHKGLSVPNDKLPDFYRQARIVLNDHWADMAAHGFISNRLFDAAAVGALVVSDEAVGVESVFGSTVRTYRTVEDLRQLLDPDATDWPSSHERQAEGERIGREHSFAVRARTLLADVLDLRGVTHDLR